MGCRLSTPATEPSQRKKSRESDEALQGSPRLVTPPIQANRPQSADGWKSSSLKKSSFKLQPIPPRKTPGTPPSGQSAVGAKAETKSEQPAGKPKPLQRLKSSLKSPSRKEGGGTDDSGAITPKRAVVFVLGGPGCGKGTQCEMIVQEFGFLHLSAGDLLREEVKKGTPVGQNCDKLMKEGKLVPVDITLGLIQKALNASGKSRVLIDGFPRAIDQAKAFEAKICRPDKVLFLECPRDVMQQRLLKRGESSGRSDDNQATIIKRFETFGTDSLPVIGHYEGLDKSILAKVSSVPSPDQVYKTIREILKKIPQLQVPA